MSLENYLIDFECLFNKHLIKLQSNIANIKRNAKVGHTREQEERDSYEMQ